MEKFQLLDQVFHPAVGCVPGQGIRILDRNDMSFEKLSAVEGLSSNEVQILRIEGDFLWVGYLENGIDVVYRPQKEK